MASTACFDYSGKNITCLPEDVLAWTDDNESCASTDDGHKKNASSDAFILLGGNKLTSIDSKLCSRHVLVLDMGSNMIDKIPPAIDLQRMTGLVSLDLRNNRVKLIKDSDGLRQLKNLTYLNMRNNGLECVPQLPPSLTELYLGQNALECLPPDIGLQIPAVRFINVSGNRLRRIPFSVCHMRCLEELDARKNRISVLTDGIAGAWNLKRLFMRDNDLSALPPALGALRNIEFWDFTRNKADVKSHQLLYTGRCHSFMERLWSRVAYTPRLHHVFGEHVQTCVYTTMLAAQRRVNVGTLPSLPPELWERVLGLLNLHGWK